VTDDKVQWPILLEEPFDSKADYSGSGTTLDSIKVLREPEDRLQSVKRCHFVQSEYSIAPMTVADNGASLHSYGAGQMAYRHGLFHAAEAQFVSPNGVILLQGGNALVEESTWQTRFHLHPQYKSNHSTKWQLDR